MLPYYGIPCIFKAGRRGLCFGQFSEKGPYKWSILCIADPEKATHYLNTLQEILPFKWRFTGEKKTLKYMNEWYNNSWCSDFKGEFPVEEFELIEFELEAEHKRELLLIGNLIKVITEYPQLIEHLPSYTAETVISDLIRTFNDLKIVGHEYGTDHFPVDRLKSLTKFPTLSEFYNAVKSKVVYNFVWPSGYNPGQSYFEKTCK